MRWSFPTFALVPRDRSAPSPSATERRRVFDWAASVGFEGVELSPRWYDVLELSPARLQELAREVLAAGLRVSGLNLNRVIPTRTEHAKLHQAMMSRAVEVAAVVGAELVNVSLSMPTQPTPNRSPLRGDAVPEEEHDRAAEFIASLGRKAQASGIKIAVELHDDGLLDSPDHCLRLLKRVGLPNVGVNPDLGNLCRGPGPVSDWRGILTTLAPQANNWHVKNYRDFQPIPIWEGVIDYPEAFRIMQAAGFDGWVSIESYFGNVFDVQRQGLDYLRSLTKAKV